MEDMEIEGMAIIGDESCHLNGSNNEVIPSVS
jgi:hypothetical protein